MPTDEEFEALERAVEEAHNTEEIPTNSPTMLIDNTTSRFSSAMWYNVVQQKSVLIAGIGGIGSYLAFLISRIKPKGMFLYDPDTVEHVNLAGQLYGISDVTVPKVSAMHNFISNYSNYHNTFALQKQYTDIERVSDIMMCGFDNMKARRVFYNQWKDHVNNKSEKNKKNCLFLDGRLNAENFQILCIRGDDEYNMNRYEEEFLFDDKDADSTICSYKQTSYCAAMIATYMTNLFVNFCANMCDPLLERDLPFFTEYDAQTMYLKTER